MGESREHRDSVQELIEWSNAYFANKKVIILSDTDESIQKPPKIGSRIPDLYATNMKTGETLIGEAKRVSDLTNPSHQKRAIIQLDFFIRYLTTKKRGILLMAVPFFVEAGFKDIIIDIKKNYNSQNFNFFFTRNKQG